MVHNWRKRGTRPQRSPQVGRAAPGHGRCRFGPNPTPGLCCEDATRATPWATTLERGRRKTSTWCCPLRWGWAAPCWTWTRRVRNETARCRSAASRALQHGRLSLSWRKSSSLEGSQLLLQTRSVLEHTDSVLASNSWRVSNQAAFFFCNIERRFVLVLGHSDVSVLERNRVCLF